MEESNNNPTLDLQSQLKIIGEGLQVIFETVENNFIELDHKLSHIKDPNLTQHSIKFLEDI